MRTTPAITLTFVFPFAYSTFHRAPEPPETVAFCVLIAKLAFAAAPLGTAAIRPPLPRTSFQPRFAGHCFPSTLSSEAPASVAVPSPATARSTAWPPRGVTIASPDATDEPARAALTVVPCSCCTTPRTDDTVQPQ